MNLPTGQTRNPNTISGKRVGAFAQNSEWRHRSVRRVGDCAQAGRTIQADFFSDPNEWTDEGAVRLDFHHKRRAFAENEIPPVTPCQQGKSLPAALERLHKSLGFHLVERICSCGWERRNRKIIPLVRPMNRGEPGGERKAENRLHGSTGARDRQEYLNEAEGRRSRRMFCVRIAPYLLDFTEATAFFVRAPRLADFCLCGQDQRASHLCGEQVRLDPFGSPKNLCLTPRLQLQFRVAGTRRPPSAPATTRAGRVPLRSRRPARRLRRRPSRSS